MVYCAAFNCKNGSSKNHETQQKVSFFSFPENKRMRDIWIEKIRRKNWKPTKSSKLCSQHFESSCFVQNFEAMQSVGWTAGRLRLKKDAVPTIFEYSVEPTSVASKRKQPTNVRTAFEKRRRQEVNIIVIVSNICLHLSKTKLYSITKLKTIL